MTYSGLMLHRFRLAFGLRGKKGTYAPRVTAISTAIVLAVCAQSAAAQVEGEATELDRVSVSGIRGSLQSSMNLKRDSFGVVDGIIAEDIGKFPDTNLAESLQRISGVSIDRTDSGEGSKVTVRGVGPDFNLVLLNGRQMPATSLMSNGYGISGSRAFDFANLASEAVSELQLYKTTRADTPTGGIGATINIRTARPLEHPGLRANIGVKGVMDRSVDNLPDSYPGKSLTPEISGIFSNTYADGRFGIAASGSYQERDSGYSYVHVPGWSILRGDDRTDPNRLPFPDEAAFAAYEITNRPGPDTIYARPVFMSYNVNAVQRQRRNGQVTLQFAPVDAITASIDYTYVDHRVQRHRDELQLAFSAAPGASRWTNGPVAAPIIYSEYIPAGNGLLPFSRVNVMTRSELKSLGFNLKWHLSDDLDLNLDYHSSAAEIRPDSPLGSSYYLGTSTFISGDVTMDFSRPLPVLNIKLPPGVAQVQPEHAVLSNTGFRRGYNRSEVEQFQVNGSFRFSGYQALDFGAATMEVYNRSASSENSNYEVDGIGTPADYADDIWQVDRMGRYFKRFSGHDAADFSDHFLIADFERLRARGIELRDEATYSPLPNYTNDLRTREKSRSAYLQWRNTFDWAIPVHIAAGVRYEKTEVNSTAQVLPPGSNIIWQAENGFRMDMADAPVFENMRGEYAYWLPNLDLRADLADNLVLRASYGKSIGRPGWDASRFRMPICALAAWAIVVIRDYCRWNRKISTCPWNGTINRGVISHLDTSAKISRTLSATVFHARRRIRFIPRWAGPTGMRRLRWAGAEKPVLCASAIISFSTMPVILGSYIPGKMPQASRPGPLPASRATRLRHFRSPPRSTSARIPWMGGS